ncbi:MAG: type II toxin-antitoxin system Phd/YefM family antitoxin [Leptolyngbyaceae bacterium]|nr:type II toxin-antitoxin system Phd/YefM family antitoxin [Leptolyngbyaceae bacterium]
MSQYSIAQAKDQLTQLIRAAETGDSVEITRHGEPVAVILSIAEYQKLQQPRPNFGEAVREFRQQYIEGQPWFENDEIDAIFDVRDKSPGREVEL